MPRMARVVLPGIPHHITQRGVRRFNIFREEQDYLLYLRLLRLYSERFGLGIDGYCLMTNHVHIVAVPDRTDSIAKALQFCHGLYASEFNTKYEQVGHVWQGRPYSCALDEAHMWAALRYVERNPVRAGMVAYAEEYVWSSARSHCDGKADPLLRETGFPASEVPNWKSWLRCESDCELEERLRERTFTGRPCGDEDFVRSAESLTGRRLTPRKPGPKPRSKGTDADSLLQEDKNE